jgi:hypothetical protein
VVSILCPALAAALLSAPPVLRFFTWLRGGGNGRTTSVSPQAAGGPNEDAIYRQLGQFVVIFQALETQLVLLASYAIDPGNAGHRAPNSPSTPSLNSDLMLQRPAFA